MVTENSPKSLALSELITLSDNYEVMSDFVMTIQALLAYRYCGNWSDFSQYELEKIFDLIDTNFIKLSKLINEQRQLSDEVLEIVRKI